MLELLDLQAAEGTALGPGWPHHALGPLRRDSLAKALLLRVSLRRWSSRRTSKSAGTVEGVERRDQRAILAVKEPPHKLGPSITIRASDWLAAWVSFKLTSGSAILR